MLCRHCKLDKEDHDVVAHTAPADFAEGVLFTVAKLRPATVMLRVVVKPRLGLSPPLTTGAVQKTSRWCRN